MSSPLRARLEASWRMSLFTRQLTQCCVAGVVTVSLVAAEARLPAAVATSLREVLARTADYSAAYGDALASVVADEQFEQELVLRREGTVLERRRLESEIAFVKLADTVDWLAFRSVLRLDGVSLSDASGQLERVFRDTPHSALAQARAITSESARHNLGPVQRNFNVPTTVLQFMLRQHQDRFRFRKITEQRAGPDVVWVVEFREQDRATFIRTPQGRDAPAQGRLWIAPDDGRVVRSQLIVKSDVHAEIDVAWRHDDRLALWVPSEMRERYRGPWTATVSSKQEAYDVHGRATYTNYRRFEVDFRIIR
jgi:hypothetical protein